MSGKKEKSKLDEVQWLEKEKIAKLELHKKPAKKWVWNTGKSTWKERDSNTSKKSVWDEMAEVDGVEVSFGRWG